jgi:hypothetical protein
MDSIGSSQADISSALQGAATVAAVTDPNDTHGMVELFGHLKQLDKHLQSSPHVYASEVCAIGMRITERLISRQDPSSEELLLWVHMLLRYLGTTVGVDVPEPSSATQLGVRPSTAPAANASHLRMAKTDGLRLGEILVQMSYLTAEEVQRALKMQQDSGCLLGEALVKLGLMTQKGLDSVLRIQQRRRASGQ